MKYSSIAIPFIIIAALACNNYCSTADTQQVAVTDTVVVDSVHVDTLTIPVDTTAK